MFVLLKYFRHFDCYGHQYQTYRAYILSYNVVSNVYDTFLLYTYLCYMLCSNSECFPHISYNFTLLHQFNCCSADACTAHTYRIHFHFPNIFFPQTLLSQLDIAGTMYHLVIYMQSNKIHTVFFNEWVYSSRMLARHVLDLTGPSSGAFYKLYLQILYVVIRVLLDTSSRYEQLDESSSTCIITYQICKYSL